MLHLFAAAKACGRANVWYGGGLNVSFLISSKILRLLISSASGRREDVDQPISGAFSEPVVKNRPFQNSRRWNLKCRIQRALRRSHVERSQLREIIKRSFRKRVSCLAWQLTDNKPSRSSPRVSTPRNA